MVYVNIIIGELEMDRFEIIDLLLMDEGFASFLKDIIMYALSTHDKCRGNLASDVLFFELKYASKIFTPEELKKIEDLKEEQTKTQNRFFNEKLKRIASELKYKNGIENE